MVPGENMADQLRAEELEAFRHVREILHDVIRQLEAGDRVSLICGTTDRGTCGSCGTCGTRGTCGT